MPDAEMMTCMEVWGGNTPVDTGVAMAGLDAWVYCKPYAGAAGGGDVYYVSACATGRIHRLLVADVSGHGSAVSDLAGQLRTLMRRYVNHLDHTQFVRSLNEQFATMARGGCFATAVVTTFFGPTGRLTLCNAGHPPPFLYRAKQKQWTQLDEQTLPSPDLANIPWGIEQATDYQAFDVQLGTDDLVLCYTDSLIESCNPQGELLGVEGLLRVVQSLEWADPAELIPKLLAAVALLREGNLTEDDVTALVFRANGKGGRLRVLDHLIAPMRMLAAATRGRSIPWPDFTLPNVGGALLPPLGRLWRKRS
jgi:sigma-B regulation protein RsbU (phosphoserine phosphatase)